MRGVNVDSNLRKLLQDISLLIIISSPMINGESQHWPHPTVATLYKSTGCDISLVRVESGRPRGCVAKHGQKIKLQEALSYE